MSQRNYLGVQDYPIPVGTIIPVIGIYSQYNDGFLICNGISVNRTTWAKLFSVIGTQFGAGDGSTTFNIPDLEGVLPKGSNANSGQGGGAFSPQINYTLAEGNMPNLTFGASGATFSANLTTSAFEDVTNTETPFEDSASSIFGYKESSKSTQNAVNVSMTAFSCSYSGSATPQTTTGAGSYTAPSYNMIYLIKGQESFGHQIIP